MKQNNWDTIESNTEDIVNSCDVIEESIDEARGMRLGNKLLQLVTTIRAECRNIRDSNDAIYTTCEDDCAEYCNDDFCYDDYAEVIELIPPVDKMSAGEYDSLKETIMNWRKANGYPLP